MRKIGALTLPLSPMFVTVSGNEETFIQLSVHSTHPRPFNVPLMKTEPIQGTLPGEAWDRRQPAFASRAVIFINSAANTEAPRNASLTDVSRGYQPLSRHLPSRIIPVNRRCACECTQWSPVCPSLRYRGCHEYKCSGAWYPPFPGD